MSELPAAAYEHLAASGQAAGIPRLPLDGQPIGAAWDPHLAPTMTALGVALHVARDAVNQSFLGRSAVPGWLV
ncbi:hypothetical protein ACFVIM_08635 [Streptomyces sp. NPDC057638]|uniref:hypothetical protein n=1 Tax=Streptomyces sp. NPDC057638 TaxID=3346190 RepID=UPI0036B4A0A0